MNRDSNVDEKKSWFGSAIARRLFLARLGAGAGVLGATAVGGSAAMAQAPADASAGAAWKSARHSQDDWLEKIPGQHRFVFDTVTPAGLDLAFTFGGNYFAASHDAYGLEDRELAVVMIARHKSTAFGYNDAMWAKYGKQFSEQSGFVDAKTNAAPTANLYAERMDALVKKGVQFAVCQMSSRRIAGMIAQATGGQAESILKDMAANLRPNSRIVPAGIVAVNRAQERGYSLVYAG